MRLSKRIYALADSVNQGDSVADIGTDHGYVPMLLMRDGKSPRVIMSDISEGSLTKARETFELAKLMDKVDASDFRIGDGLETVRKGEVDEIIIGGLGGHTIAGILDADTDKSRSFKRLVLQPRKHSGSLRYYLYTHGWDIESERLNESTSPYGIVMIDLNGLKSINDNYGHEKGDVSIKTLCQIVCRVFKHSPVYRVGGDEFVVILENDDFEERDTLIQSIKDIFTQNAGDTSLQPWERVTAAVGCAVCDHETDENVERVLQRADTAMYENKKTMKETL